MIISVINHAAPSVKDEEIQRVVRAINRQITGDFAPYWSLGATLRLEGRSGRSPSKQSLADMRGDAVIYVWDGSDADDAVGYHEINNRGIPCGFVFTEVAKELKEHWSVTLSHEALELIGDPEANLLAMGPHPVHPGRDVFHYYEMCDAVQDEVYEIDGVEVSNFVLPLYFTGGDETGGRNDFLGRLHPGGTLRSFNVNPGGYVGFFDAKLGKDLTFEADAKAERRQRIKGRLGQARRGNRYRRFHTDPTTPILRVAKGGRR
ncbi:MAG TPA: hypothetical protein VKA21_09015 [Candidatus Binatia bacterium]|nr:hypothetical protein [Candidatus Binatia bacterium]